jgi:transposase-like protein
MGRPFKCPYCGSSDTVSKGVRRNKTLGDRRVRRCKACKRKFTPKNQQPVEPSPLPTPEAAAAPGTPSAPGEV